MAKEEIADVGMRGRIMSDEMAKDEITDVGMRGKIMSNTMTKDGITIDTARENDKLTITIKGRLDTVTAPYLEEQLNANMEGINELALDFTSLEFISSAGLRILLTTHKAMKGRNGVMAVKGLNEEVREVFSITGFLDILNVE